MDDIRVVQALQEQQARIDHLERYGERGSHGLVGRRKKKNVFFRIWSKILDRLF